MSVDYTYVLVFMMAIFGGGHCFGMCGGIVGALTFGLKEEKRQNLMSTFPYILAYNLGRLSSYAMAGAIAASLSLFTTNLLAINDAKQHLQTVAGIFMIAMGLYLGGWWAGMMKVEQLGSRLWRYIEPLGRRLMPVQTLGQAFLLGIVWGWLPCGLVYSALIFALATSSIEKGALIMLSFGLGTLPTVMSMGILTSIFGSMFRTPLVRKLAGTMTILFGAYMIWQSTGHKFPSF